MIKDKPESQVFCYLTNDYPLFQLAEVSKGHRKASLFLIKKKKSDINVVKGVDQSNSVGLTHTSYSKDKLESM